MSGPSGAPVRPPAHAPAWRGYLALSLVWSIVLAAAVWVSRRPATEPIIILPPPTPAMTVAPTAEPTPSPGPLLIDVAGAVRSPGVYTLLPGSIVADAITAAGGAAEDADLDRLNKAVALEDRMQVYVPHRDEPPSSVRQPIVPYAPPQDSGTPAAAGQPEGGPQADTALVDLNTASLAELDTLPGVGAVTAQKIVDGRPYGAIEDLLRVNGIGEAKFAKLKDLVTVR